MNIEVTYKPKDIDNAMTMKELLIAYGDTAFRRGLSAWFRHTLERRGCQWALDASQEVVDEIRAGAYPHADVVSGDSLKRAVANRHPFIRGDYE